MAAQVLDGEQVAAGIKARLADRVQALIARGVTPGLGTVLVASVCGYLVSSLSAGTMMKRLGVGGLLSGSGAPSASGR